MAPFMSMIFKGFRTSKTISYDSEWKISFMSDNDIETGFLVHLQTLDILDTKKVLPFIMTDEIYQLSHVRKYDHHKFNRDMVWGFKVEKLALVHNMDPRSTNLPRLIWLIQNELKVLIRLAKNKFDVVLIDTMGRMEALAKLISVNNPDKMIFALVGNEAVDQLTKLNQALGFFWIME
ncbi:hypothetical protein RhiirC2_717501 [Rhizophagus irregularis]|uniref:Uncharacterized protein n=1 Tax=Rhizophagus irregularis TaxID=588596 RepID=A0A2N1MM48_9GLOM|nr:hypothetical protein RhiirC2_717501 [Rhizophagus irregularis]